jgi:putative tryptophan/tyrosine transport system substrate-binding protein
MQRRSFLRALSGLVICPTLAIAQGKHRPRIGVLMPGTPTSYVARLDELRRGLKDYGYQEPQTMELIVRYGTAPDQLLALAQELVNLGVDLIVTNATPGARAAMAATAKIPIVIAAAADVVGTGLVASLAKPGGNVTGMTLLIPDLAAKQMELIKEFVPRLTRIGVLRGRNEGAQSFETVQAAASIIGIEPHFQEIADSNGITEAFVRLENAHCQAIIIVDGPTTNSAAALVAKNALSVRIPTISTLRLFVEAGSLVAYGPNLGSMYRRASYFVDRILKGTPPRELPIEQPNTFELVINQKTATLLGLAISPTLLARADAVLD